MPKRFRWPRKLVSAKKIMSFSISKLSGLSKLSELSYFLASLTCLIYLTGSGHPTGNVASRHRPAVSPRPTGFAERGEGERTSLLTDRQSGGRLGTLGLDSGHKRSFGCHARIMI